MLKNDIRIYENRIKERFLVIISFIFEITFLLKKPQYTHKISLHIIIINVWPPSLLISLNCARHNIDYTRERESADYQTKTKALLCVKRNYCNGISRDLRSIDQICLFSEKTIRERSV